MVERRFNRPLYEINKVPIAWISDRRTTTWCCNICDKEMGKASIVVEMFGKRKIVAETVGNDGKMIKEYKEYVVKKFVCTKCASELYEKALDKVKLIGERGIDVYRLMEEM